MSNDILLSQEFNQEFKKRTIALGFAKCMRKSI